MADRTRRLSPRSYEDIMVTPRDMVSCGAAMVAVDEEGVG